MANKSQTQDPATSSAAEPFNAMAQFQEAGFGNMIGMGTAWVEALSDMSAEVVGFVADRIKEDVKTQHEILHCKNAADLQHIQAQFMQNALDQYKAETGKLVEMTTKAFGSNGYKTGSKSQPKTSRPGAASNASKEVGERRRGPLRFFSHFVQCGHHDPSLGWWLSNQSEAVICASPSSLCPQRKCRPTWPGSDNMPPLWPPRVKTNVTSVSVSNDNLNTEGHGDT
jgi:hypothetical protein